MKLRFLTYNSQTHFYDESELYNYDLSDVDIVFLQRCRPELKDSITGFKSYWDPDSKLCVLTNLDVTIEHYSGMQKVTYGDNVFVNFLVPLGDTVTQDMYLEKMMALQADVYAGDTHGYTGNALTGAYRVLNTLSNFTTNNSIVKLTYVIVNTDKFSLSNEVVIPKYLQEKRHLPVKFTLTRL
jgi:hypothetical protein